MNLENISLSTTHTTRPSCLLVGQRGSVTLDWLFGLVMVMGFAGILFALALTLTMVESTQYITFAAAHNYMTSHFTQEDQKERAMAKYQQLVSDPTFGPMFGNGWFQVGQNPGIGDMSDFRPEYEANPLGINLLIGVGTEFKAKVLDFRIPFYGSTAPDGDGDGNGFITFIGSYLGRESTMEECLNFNNHRWEAIRALSPQLYGASGSGSDYVPMADNGC